MMSTAWSKFGINISKFGINIVELFLFLAFDPEGEKWHPTPEGRHFRTMS